MLPMGNKKILFFFILTWFNIVYSIWLSDLTIFLLRQGFLILIVVGHYFFGDELVRLPDENKYIRETLEKKYPILKLERVLIWAVFPSLFISVQMQFFNYPLLCYMAYFVCSLYFVMVGFSVYYILQTPEVNKFYNVRQSIKNHGFRSFSTFSKTAHSCKICFKSVSAACATAYLGPKLVYGPDYRSTILSDVTYPFNGFKTNSEADLSLGGYLTGAYLEENPLITESDGVTINRSKLLSQLKKRSLPRPINWWA